MKDKASSSAVVSAILGILAAGVVVLVFGPAWTPLNSDFHRKQDIDRARVSVLVRPDTSLEVREALNVRQSKRRDSLEVHEDVVTPPGATVDRVSATDRGGHTDPEDAESGSSERRSAYGALDATATPTREGVRLTWTLADTGMGGEHRVDVAYRATRVAHAYDDVVFVRWNVWAPTWDFPLDDLTASIGLAEPRGERPLGAWVGPADLLATTEPVRDGESEVTLTHLPAGRAVTIAALFPRSAFRSVDGAVVHRGDGRAAIVAREERALADATGRRVGWAWDHQLELLGALLVLLSAGTAVLIALGRDAKSPDAPVILAHPPEVLSPAAANWLATMKHDGDELVLPTLLDLVDRGFYEATIDTVPGRGSSPDRRPDLVLAIAEYRPSQGSLREGERATLAFFDELIGREPGALSALQTRIERSDAAWRERWAAMSDLLGDDGNHEAGWAADLRPWNKALLTLGLLGLGAIAFAAEPRASHHWHLFAAIPLVLAIYTTPSSEMLRHLDEPSLRRHRNWLAFAEWTRLPPSRREPVWLSAEQWNRVLVYALAFGTLRRMADSGQVPTHGPAPATWWAGLADQPLAFLADTSLGRNFGSDFAGHLAPEDS